LIEKRNTFRDMMRNIAQRLAGVLPKCTGEIAFVSPRALLEARMIAGNEQRVPSARGARRKGLPVGVMNDR